jgi:hypothetical protein
MSEGQIIGSECGVAADLLEEAGLVNAAAVLREMAAQVKVLEVPPRATCVFELPKGQNLTDEGRARMSAVWERMLPDTKCVILENGMSLRAVLSQPPGP